MGLLGEADKICYSSQPQEVDGATFHAFKPCFFVVVAVDVKILHTNQHVVLEKHTNPVEEGPVGLLYICPL